MQKPLIHSRRHRVVLVDQSAEDICPLDPVRQPGRKLHRTVGDRQIEPSVRSLLVVVPEGCTYSDRGPDQGFPSGPVRLYRNPETDPMMADGSLLRSGGETWGPVSPENVEKNR